MQQLKSLVPDMKVCINVQYRMVNYICTVVHIVVLLLLSVCGEVVDEEEEEEEEESIDKTSMSFMHVLTSSLYTI